MLTPDKRQVAVWGVAALLAVALVATLASVGVLHVAGVWSPFVTPTPARAAVPGSRLPSSRAPAGDPPSFRAVQPAPAAPRSSIPQLGSDGWRREEAQRRAAACDQQWREYLVDYAAYLDRKTTGAGIFNAAPSKPWC